MHFSSLNEYQSPHLVVFNSNEYWLSRLLFLKLGEREDHPEE